MILVDSSVWIDYFNGVVSPYTAKLDSLLGFELIAIGDIILTEILQGFQSDKDFNTAKSVLLSLTVFDMLGQKNALAAAENYRFLRKKGITVRKTVDCLIATFCIQNGHSLLCCDWDFQPFVEYLGLGSVAV
jgi:predicted nucleic acid-binding protein